VFAKNKRKKKFSKGKNTGEKKGRGQTERPKEKNIVQSMGKKISGKKLKRLGNSSGSTPFQVLTTSYWDDDLESGEKDPGRDARMAKNGPTDRESQ